MSKEEMKRIRKPAARPVGEILASLEERLLIGTVKMPPDEIPAHYDRIRELFGELKRRLKRGGSEDEA